MAITLVDGTVLPDIPVAPLTTHQYYIICKMSGSVFEAQFGASEIYGLTFGSTPFVAAPAALSGDSNDTVSCETVGVYSFMYIGDADGWVKDQGTDDNGYADSTTFSTMLGSLYDGMMEAELLYSNHDILTSTGEIYFANSEAPAYEYSDVYIADKDWIIGVADQARRLGGTTAKLDDAGILAAFKAVPDPSGETVDELAKSIVERTITSLNNEDFTSIGSSGMRHCAKLTDVVLPNVTTLGQYAFYQCTALKRVELPLVTSIGNYGFGNCSVLEALILANTAAVCTLSNSNAFTGTLIASGTGYIYVPSALLDSYKAATNWSTYAAQFRAIEDYPDICGATE